MKILNSKEIKEVTKLLREQYGYEEKMPYVYVINENDLYIVSEGARDVELEKLRTRVLGLYIAEIKNGQIRLSIEGSQVIGPKAKKNVLEVDDKLMKMWMYGLDIPSAEFEGFVIVKHDEDYLGSGKYKEGKLINHVPKGRRIHE